MRLRRGVALSPARGVALPRGRRAPAPPLPPRRPTSRACRRVDRLKQELRAAPADPAAHAGGAAALRRPAPVPADRGAQRGRRSSALLPAAARRRGPRRRRGAAKRAAAPPSRAIRDGHRQGAHRQRPPVGEAYVYVDGLRASARGRTVEIRQHDKQFSPRVAVVPVGTSCCSRTRTRSSTTCSRTRPATRSISASVKGGEKSPPVVLLKPGPVEIFCNIHSKMRADVLVVPNATGRAWRPTARFSCPASRSARADRVVGPDAQAGVAAGRGHRQGRQRDVHVGGGVAAPAHEQARPGLRFVR